MGWGDYTTEHECPSQLAAISAMTTAVINKICFTRGSWEAR
jgi:hypothetical protein